jgi:hypothetical protein
MEQSGTEELQRAHEAMDVVQASLEYSEVDENQNVIGNNYQLMSSL